MLRLSLILTAVLFPCLTWAASIIGGETLYIVKRGDTLQVISARLGVGTKHILEGNDLDPKKPLRVGQMLKVNTTRIVPTPSLAEIT